MKIILSGLALLLLTSCMSFSDRELRPVRDSITAQLPDVTLKKEFAVSMGAGMFHLLDLVTFNEADLSELDRVRVAVYEIETRRRDPVDLREVNFNNSFAARYPGLNWETIVRVNEQDERVWVLAGMNPRRQVLEAVSVIALEHNELVLVYVDGDFEDLIEFALEPSRRSHRYEA